MDQKFILNINSKIFYPNDTDDLLRNLTDLANYRNNQFAEIWLSTEKENAPSICVLINNDRASLIYLRYNDDIGYGARDLIQSNTTDMIKFYLSNGQLDQYPISSTIPINDALNALKYFYIYQDMYPKITWHDDGE